RHPPADRTVLGLLSLLARQVPVETLAAAAVLPTDDVLGSLSALSAAGLVRLGDRGWATSHDLVRETVAADLAEADRARLDARLALADRGEPRNRLLEVRARLRARRGDLPGARSDLREALIAEPDLAA